MIAFYVVVGIPVATRKSVFVTTENLDETNAAFEQASRRQTFSAEELRFGFVIDFGIINARALWR